MKKTYHIVVTIEEQKPEPKKFEDVFTPEYFEERREILKKIERIFRRN